MRFNSMVSEKPYQGLKSKRRLSERRVVSQGRLDRCCMVAVSSCLEMFPSVGKRAQPLPRVTSVTGDCRLLPEEGGDDVKSAWPSDALGDTHATMADTKGC